MSPASVWTSTRIKAASVVISCAVQLGWARAIDMGCALTAVIFNVLPPFSPTSLPFQGAMAPLPGPGEGKNAVTLGLYPLAVQRVAQDASRQRAGMAAVFEQHLSVDDGVLDASGE